MRTLHSLTPQLLQKVVFYDNTTICHSHFHDGSSFLRAIPAYHAGCIEDIIPTTSGWGIMCFCRTCTDAVPISTRAHYTTIVLDPLSMKVIQPMVGGSYQCLNCEAEQHPEPWQGLDPPTTGNPMVGTEEDDGGEDNLDHEHEFDETGYCGDCDYQCDHNFTEGICNYCGIIQ